MDRRRTVNSSQQSNLGASSSIPRPRQSLLPAKLPFGRASLEPQSVLRSQSLQGSWSVSRPSNALRMSTAPEYPQTDRKRHSTLNPSTPSSYSYRAPAIQDPRPSRSAEVRKRYAQEIEAFLLAQNYPGPGGVTGLPGPPLEKQLLQPTGAHFQTIFKFLISVLDSSLSAKFAQLPGAGHSVSRKFEDDFFQVLGVNGVGYPFTSSITKNHLHSIGAQQSWPNMLAMLHWLVVCIEQRENAFTSSVFLQVPDPENENDPTQSVGMVQGELTFSAWIEFLTNAYPVFLHAPQDEDPEFAEELEIFTQRLEDGRTKLRALVEQHETTYRRLEHEWDQLMAHPDPLIAAKEEVEKHENDVGTFTKFIKTTNRKLEQREHEKKKAIAKHDELVKTIEANSDNIRRITNAVANQGITPTELAQLTDAKASLMTQHSALNKRQAAKLDSIMSFEVELQKRFDSVNNLIGLYSTKAQQLGLLPGPANVEGYEELTFDQELNSASENPVPESIGQIKGALIELRARSRAKSEYTDAEDLNLEENITKIREVIGELEEVADEEEVQLEQIESRNSSVKDVAQLENTAANAELDQLYSEVVQLTNSAGLALSAAQARCDTRTKELAAKEVEVNEVRRKTREALERALEDIFSHKSIVMEKTQTIVGLVEELVKDDGRY